MAFGVIENIAVKGMCAAVPVGYVETDSYAEKFGAQGIKRFKKMTGVLKRHVSTPPQTSSDLCFTAAEALLAHLGWARDSVGILLLVTPTPDHKIPAASCLLQHRLGLSEDCIALDINLGCSGFVYGLAAAAGLMRGSARRALLMVGDSPNKDVAAEDKSSAMLFSDIGAVTALEISEGSPDMRYLLRTGGYGFKSIIKLAGGARMPQGSAEVKDRGDGFIRSDYQNYMNGAEVFNFSIDKPVKAHFDFIEKTGLDAGAIDYFIYHQANKFIIDNIVERVKVPAEKVPISIDRFGNTSGASLPMTIIDLCGRIGPGRTLHLMLNGFGVGLSWGVADMRVSSDVCLPIIYSDSYYDI